MRSAGYRLHKKQPYATIAVEAKNPSFHFQPLSQLSFANLRVLEYTYTDH